MDNLGYSIARLQLNNISCLRHARLHNIILVEAMTAAHDINHRNPVKRIILWYKSDNYL